MRDRGFATMVTLLVLAAACSGENRTATSNTGGATGNGGSSPTGATGGTESGIPNGGATGTGSSTLSGGASTTNVTSAVGGTSMVASSAVAGGSSTGGTPSSGGNTATGGVTSSGGNPATGGSAQTGGIPSTGGTNTAGGNSALGGTKAAGGSSSAGGASPSGGTVASTGTMSDPLDPSLAPALDQDASHYPANVWVTDGMVKVHPDQAPGAVHWADLWAAKNEFESLQVHVRASSTNMQVSVSVSDLVDARSGTHIAASDHVFVFREAYLNITTRSDANGTLGQTPDPLIPTVDPYVHETRNAFPVTIPTGETRSAWIDVLVPQNAPSGYYTGTVTVTDGTTTLATLPVRLAVWDFALPSTATLRSGFGLGWDSLCTQAYGDYYACNAFPGAGGDSDKATELTHVQQGKLFLDYRVSLADVVYAPVTGTDFTHFDAVYGPLLGGTADTRLPGAKLTGIWYTGDDTDSAQMSNWRDHFAAATNWGTLSAAYYCDEPPNGCSWSEALSRATAIHTATPGLLTLLTTDYSSASAHGLLDAVDVLVSIVEEMEPRGGTNARSSYDTWLTKPNKHLWWYQSCDEHESCDNGSPGPAESTWPSYMVDATPTRNRVFQWLAYLDRIEGELYYASDYCWTADDCGDATSGNTRDPWVSIYAFGGNGDGTLYYPGTPAKISGSTPVPVPSLRLSLIRDGMEDFEYLHALDAAGDGAFASTTARGFITNATTFNNDPAALQSARRALGDRLHRRAHP
jgi:hypothetical protein